MKWRVPTMKDKHGREHRNECCIEREDGRYRINRAPQDGFVAVGGTITYMLTSGSDILHVERGVADTEDARREAVRKLQALCQ